MLRNTVIFLGFSAFLISGTAIAGEIYKWVDADGNVHYEDRPVGENVERVDIVSRSTDNSQVQAATQARRDNEAARLEARAERDKAAQAKLEAEQETAERAAKCQENRARMESFIAARRLYQEDDNGERVYLDEEKTLAAHEQVREQIEKYCD
ncbi:MAG: DUF4124 domain-containing protein [Pseudomonadota bacterium]